MVVFAEYVRGPLAHKGAPAGHVVGAADAKIPDSDSDSDSGSCSGLVSL
jgi:hypothetical protein